MFSTYVLYSTRFDKIYIGQTEDIDRRFLTHNSDQNDVWTASFKPWELLHLEIFETRAQAMHQKFDRTKNKSIAHYFDRVVRQPADGSNPVPTTLLLCTNSLGRVLRIPFPAFGIFGANIYLELHNVYLKFKKLIWVATYLYRLY